MTQWYVKELSKLTQVSVRTLHHYDAIDLLNPSVRLDNGYRLYSESDLLKLQQIIALKYFGFELSQIKTLLGGNVNMVEHFLVQAQFLQEKAQALLEASETLKSITADCSRDKSISWETIIKLIEVYRMTQQLEKTWAGEILNPQELKEYASFEAGLKSRFSEQDKKNFEQNWAALVGQIGSNLDKDPDSDFGIAIGKRCMELVNSLYGKKHAALRSAIWEKGFKAGKMDSEHSLSPDIVAWLDKAMDIYYRKRIYNILDQAQINSPITLLKQWEELLEEMCGDSDCLKQEIFDSAMKDERVGAEARNWLIKIDKS